MKAKTIVALVMWAFGAFMALYWGLYQGLEVYSIKGSIWIVGAILMQWMPDK